MGDALRKKLFIALLAAIFCLMLALNILTPFTADDYTYSLSFVTGERITSLEQLVPSLIAHGRDMNGRYAPHFFVHLFTMLPGTAFDLCNAVMFMLLLAGMYALTKSERRWDVTLLLLLAATLFVVLPDFAGPMLWMAGSCNYLWLAAAAVWLLKPFTDTLLRGKAAPKPLALCALCALGLLAGNTSESMSATLALMMFLCAIYAWFDTRRAPWWMLAVALSVLVGWLLLALAPGDRGRIGSAMSVSFLTRRFLAALELYKETLLPLTAAYCFLLAFALGRGLKRETVLFSALLFAGALISNGVMALADYYPYRAMLWPCMLALLACAALAAPLSAALKPLLQSATACVCCLALLAALQALPDCFDRYQLNRARNADIVAQRDAGVTDVKTFGLLSKSKYDPYNDLMELTTEAEYRVNLSMATYYGVRTVVAERFE